MQRIPVKSSQIYSIGFENGVMEIEFHARGDRANGAFIPGPVYRYTGDLVETHYRNLMQQHVTEGGSVGLYFGKSVRNCAQTKCERITDV